MSLPRPIVDGANKLMRFRATLNDIQTYQTYYFRLRPLFEVRKTAVKRKELYDTQHLTSLDQNDRMVPAEALCFKTTCLEMHEAVMTY